jgi:tetratricopeptide (TPR) repeat protein
MRLQKFDEARVSIHEGLELYKKTGHKWGQGVSHFIQGRIELESGESIAAGIYLRQSALDFQESGDIWGQALSLNSLGSLYLQMGELDLAQTECEKSLRLREAMRDQWGINSCYLNLGDIARLQNRTAQENFYYEKSCELGREMGLKGDMARAINCLGFAALHGNNVNKAKMHFSQSLKTYTEMKNMRGICECLAGCAGLAVAQGNIGRAIALLAATDAVLKANGIKMWRVDQVDFEAHLATVRGALQETEFTEAWNAGRAQSVDEAVAIAWTELGQ